MKVTPTAIPEVLLIEPKVFGDSRGFFFESFNQKAFEQATGLKVALVGWSLGGLYARLIAHRHPHMVSAVATLGTPFSGDPHANNAWRLYELLSGHKVTNSPFAEDISAKPPVPTMAFWSAQDGVISPENARGLPHESDRQEELAGGHIELATRAANVRRIITVLGEVLG